MLMVSVMGARLKAAVDAAGGVGQHHLFNAQQLEHIEGITDLLHGVALVEVEPALHGQHWGVSQLALQQGALVARHGGPGEAGDVGIGNLHGVGETGGQVPQAGAQHHRNFGGKAQFLLQIGRAGRGFFIQIVHILSPLLFLLLYGPAGPLARRPAL